MKPRTIYDRKRVQFSTSGVERTQQQFKKQCDINNIMEKYRKTGVLPQMREKVQAYYDDFSEAKDFQESLNIVIKAQESFDSLDSKTRARFGHNPANLVAFLSDEKNLEEARKLGLCKPLPEPVEERVMKVEVVDKIKETPKGGASS